MHIQNADEHQDGHALDPVLQRLAALEAMLAGQQERLAQQEEEIERLRAALESGDAQTELILPASMPRRMQRGLASRFTSRRSLLKIGGVAAAAGVVAAAADMVARPPTARAAGVQWATGTVSADTETLVKPSSTSYPSNDILQIQLGTGSVYSPAPLKAGITAYDTTGVNMGVYGSSSSGYGLVGVTDTGAGATGAGLKGGAASSGTGVLGNSGSGIGVQGNSSSGIGGSFSGGQAPLALGLAGAGGPPTTGAHVAGEIYADANGILWVCNRSGNFSTSTPPSYYRLSSVVMLTSPTRLLDTRPGQPALTDWGAPLSAQQTRALQVAGFTYNGQTIPSGVQAVLGTVTVLGPGGNGNLAIWPTGGPQPQGVAITFNAGAFLANFNIVGVGTGNQINIQNQCNGNTNLVYDAVGYII
jgi:hypothetical protein